MNNYRKLAIRYLKMNKKRSMVTVFGVTVAAMVLYTILNLGWSALLNYRETLRKEKDYEIVLFTETQKQIEQIMADEQIKSASVGQYYVDSYDDPKVYHNALYINTTNPYRMMKILERFQDKYGVEGETNRELAMTYMQDGEDNLIYITVLFVLLISFIFAIFGVGIVRNSIQLSTLEQIKDYGNLRCVGASKGQLKMIIYLEGTILEVTGNIIGILLGFILSLLIGHYLKWKVGFHFLPVIPLLVAFLGDLYFAMEENCKMIANMTPVSAIRGEYRIRKEKIKVRKRSIFGKLFGLEGDYAYKSIMRNPGRFHKTVWTMGISMAAFIAVAGSTATIKNVIKEEEERYKYYPILFEEYFDVTQTVDEVQSNLPSAKILQSISDMKEVTEAKRIYSSPVMLTNYEEIYAHYTEDYLSQTMIGEALQNYYERTHNKEGEITEFARNNILRYESEIPCYGYDDVDYARYQSALVDGTLDVSENGLILVNGGNVVKNTNNDSLSVEYVDAKYTNYKVGDTVDVLDMAKYRSMINERMKKLKSEYEVKKEKLPQLNQEEKEDPDTPDPELEIEQEYNIKKNEISIECWQQLIEEGAYKTYTIEGIVSEDVNRYSEGIAFILPLKQYYIFTGMDESMTNGMQYHFEKIPTKKLSRILELDGMYIETDLETTLGYLYIMQIFDKMKNINFGFMLGIIFFVIMSTLNIINTVASNLHLRRKEFAQLRVIGVSKKRLMKMVMLEGVISALVANVIGIFLGSLIIAGNLGNIIYFVFAITYQFPFAAAVAGVFVSILIFCGSVYVPLRGLKQDMAGDLATGGD